MHIATCQCVCSSPPVPPPAKRHALFSIQAVQRSHHELAALMAHRNRLAAYMAGGGQQPARVPPMLQGSYACERCPIAGTCATFHRVGTYLDPPASSQESRSVKICLWAVCCGAHMRQPVSKDALFEAGPASQWPVALGSTCDPNHTSNIRPAPGTSSPYGTPTRRMATQPVDACHQFPTWS